MNKTLEISAMQNDFHTLLKVSDICGLTGEIGFHDTDTGYLVSFPDDSGIYRRRKRARKFNNYGAFLFGCRFRSRYDYYDEMCVYAGTGK